jgi:hypothetical protein
MFKRLLAVSLGALIGCSTLVMFGQARAAEKGPPGKAPTGGKAGLTPESLPKVLALVRPQENEWRHLKVRWLTDVVAARKRAAAEDKPIVICYTGGAGYNEPLGTC